MENKEEIKEFQNYLILEALALNKDPERYVKELGEDGLKEAYQRFLKSKKKKALKAAHGAKLQYFKSLKHQCAEDEELVYYKSGGSLGCGCVKKKMEEGGQAPKKSPVDKFKNVWTKKDELKLDSLSSQKKLTPQGQKEKERLQNKFKKAPNRKDYEIDEGKKGMKVEKDCGGSAVIAKFKAKCGAKMKKHELGGNLNKVSFYQDGGKNKKSINDYYLTDYSEPNILQKAKLNGKELTIKVNKGQLKGEDPITIQGNNYYLKGDSTLVKDNSIPYSFLQLRNAGVNKKYNGGSLNQIPFMLQGTNKNILDKLNLQLQKALLLWNNIDHYIQLQEKSRINELLKRKYFGLGPNYNKLMKIRKALLMLENPEIVNQIDSTLVKYQNKKY